MDIYIWKKRTNKKNIYIISIFFGRYAQLTAKLLAKPFATSLVKASTKAFAWVR